MAKPIVAEYKCTQQELYSITDTVYNNLENNLPTFAAYKSKYDADFVAALRANRKAAMDLPDVEARNTTSETLRLELSPLGDTCRSYFQTLKGYIKDAFPEDQQKTKYDAAGQKKYAAAANENWEELTGMNTGMNDFITINMAVLTTKGFMPAAFVTNVTAAIKAFTDKYSEFKLARQTPPLTAKKLTANNLLNKDVTDLCAEGQLVYRNDAAMKQLFVFATVKDLVSPPGSASLKTAIKKSGANTVIPHAKVTIQTEGGVAMVAISGEDGTALHENINPGTYNCTVEVEGMPPMNFVKEVNTGTAARKEVFV